MKKSSINGMFLAFAALVFGALVVPVSLEAQVDRSELGNLGPVEFVNYEGPYSIIETRAQIRSIGYTLGQAVRGGAARSGGAGRYFVIHAAGPADGLKLDADIFGLGVDVGVDHIRNLRLIIQGYLEAAYGYTESDAALLAEYVTVYNAVYRGDLEYFGSRYKKAVMDNLVKEKAGLSLRYDEWPGQALIVIPLGTGAGGDLSSIDTTSISDRRVTESLRQEPGASIDERKDMVDLKEREAEQAAQQAEISREAIRQEEERIARERREAEERETQARQQEQQARQQEQQARQQEEQARQQEEQASQQEEQARQREQEARDVEARQQAQQQQQQARQQQQQAQQQQQQAQQQQQQARQQQQQAQQQQQQVEEQKQEVEQQEAFAEQKTSEAQEERQQIAEDQQAGLDQMPAVEPAGGVLGIAILNNNSSLGRLVRLNVETGAETLRSPLNTVNVRTVSVVDGRIFAVAGESRANGAIRLVEIKPDTLEMQKQGDDDIAPQSLLWVNGQNLFAVTSSGSNLYLSRFNADLVQQAKSSVTVHPFASVLFSDEYIVTQRADGSALLLDPNDLTERK